MNTFKLPFGTTLQDHLTARDKCLENNKCFGCYEDINQKPFRDKLSKKEASMSGLCMDCQDEYFCDEPTHDQALWVAVTRLKNPEPGKNLFIVKEAPEDGKTH